MIEIEINGEKFLAEDGSTVIEAADSAGIHIPRFCYHKKLSVAANCRMCLVEVENSRKPLPACATPVTPGMKVFTKSESTRDAQKSVMEYLLVNHPLDCPICDQGGECELQDLSMGYGDGQSCSNQPKRSINADDIGPLIDTKGMTRCIYCTRCVRFGEEVAGLRELGVSKRGENSEVGTYIPHLMHSEVSANVIDLCPVGALTSKPFRFKARSWELTEKPSIAAHDCWGSNIYCHVRDRSDKEQPQLMRVVPRANESINENWLSDRDRFAYQALAHKDRLLQPEVKRADNWQKVGWQDALPTMLDKVRQLIADHGTENVCVVASPNISTESAYAISQFMAELGVKNTDYRTHCLDFSDKTSRADLYGLAKPIEYIETCDRILMLGANVRQEQPLAALRMRKACQEGAITHSIDSYEHNYNFPVQMHVQHPQQWLCSIAMIINSLLQTGISLPDGYEYAEQFVDLGIDDDAAQVAKDLLEGKQKLIWLGSGVYRHPGSVALISMARILATMLDCELAVMKDGANVGGMHLAGLVPHTNLGGNLMEQPGDDLMQCLEQPRKAYIFFGLDPEHDFAAQSLVKSSVEQAELVVAFTAFSSDFLRSNADYLLPITTTAEESGSLINITGQKQSYAAAVPAPGTAKPTWKLMHQLARIAGFTELQEDLKSIPSIDDTLQAVYQASIGAALETPDIDIHNVTIEPVCELFWRVGPWPLYSVNSEVRRAPALQAVQEKLLPQNAVTMHSKTAAKINSKKVRITYASESKDFDIIVDDKLAVGCMLLPSGTEQTAAWGSAEGCVQVGSAQDD